MKVIFETTGGHRLDAELVGDDLKRLVSKVTGLCQMVRTMSVKDVDVTGLVEDHFNRFELLVRERPTRG